MLMHKGITQYSSPLRWVVNVIFHLTVFLYNQSQLLNFCALHVNISIHLALSYKYFRAWFDMNAYFKLFCDEQNIVILHSYSM